MILVLQQQLRESKDQIAQLQEENSQLREGGTYSPKHRDKSETKVKTEEIGPFKCKVKKEESRHGSKGSRTYSTDFTPMETGYDEKETEGDSEYGQGDGYGQYEDESYYDDYRDSYSPYGNKDNKYSYDDAEYENGYGERTDRSDRTDRKGEWNERTERNGERTDRTERKEESHERKHTKDSKEIKHESMEVDEETPQSDHHRTSSKLDEKTNMVHHSVSKHSRHHDDAEMTTYPKDKADVRAKGQQENETRQHQSSSLQHHSRETDMDVEHEEISTVTSSTHSHRENRDSGSTDRNKGNRSPHNKLTKEQLSEEVTNSDVHLKTSPKAESRHNADSKDSDKVSPSRASKSGIQLLIEPRPPKDSSNPSKDPKSDRTSPKPHSSPPRTKSPKGQLSPSPHKDRSSPVAGNEDRSPVRAGSPHTTDNASKDSPSKDKSPGSASSPFKEREPVLQKFLNGVTSTVDDIEDL